MPRPRILPWFFPVTTQHFKYWPSPYLAHYSLLTYSSPIQFLDCSIVSLIPSCGRWVSVEFEGKAFKLFYAERTWPSSRFCSNLCSQSIYSIISFDAFEIFLKVDRKFGSFIFSPSRARRIENFTLPRTHTTLCLVDLFFKFLFRFSAGRK